MADEPPDDEDAPRLAIRRPAPGEEPHVGSVPFTDAASEELNRLIDVYADNLVDMAVRTARERDSREIISAGDVRQASQRLAVRSRSVWPQVVGTLGGLLLGAALGNVFQIAGSPVVTPESALL